MATKEQRQRRKQELELDKKFSIAVKNRDAWRCAICNMNNNLNCHHIIPREDRTLRHDIMNGITLCILHHKFSLDISPHKNAFVFIDWLERNRIEQYNYLKSRISNKQAKDKQ